ncbi:Uncharacterised protein [Klebsiella variicola]|nr:Uncharacterised protein [Klebsiella variicola]
MVKKRSGEERVGFSTGVKTAIPDKNARHLRCNLQNDNNFFTKYLDDREEKRQGNDTNRLPGGDSHPAIQ